MNYFVEGLQGSGKSTLVRKLSEMNREYTAVREGEYSPVELSWCAYVDAGQYDEILENYPDLRPQIEEKTLTLNSMRSIITGFLLTGFSLLCSGVIRNGIRIA